MAELVHGHPHDHGEPWPPITVTLRRPPPLDTSVPATETDGVTTAADDVGPVAQAQRSDQALAEVEAVDAATARAAEASYAGWVTHPFTSCFTCGPDREEGDGLRIFPGPVDDLDGATRVAAVWTPHPSTAEDWHAYEDDHRRASVPVTWAALDCPGGWAADLATTPAVLGRMTARVDTLPGRRRGARRRRPLPRPRRPQAAHRRDPVRRRRPGRRHGRAHLDHRRPRRLPLTTHRFVCGLLRVFPLGAADESVSGWRP